MSTTLNTSAVLPTLGIAPQEKSKRIGALDGVRGIAIILVLFAHFTPDTHVRARLTEWIYKLAWSGWIGVDLFFVLSGFLITRILCNTRHLPGYFRNFYARRTLRIFPLYYGTLFLIFVLIPQIRQLDFLGLRELRKVQWWFWLYGSNIGIALHGTTKGFCDTDWVALSHFWSLAVEEHFYLVWPAVIYLVSKRWLSAACVGLLSLALLSRLLFALLVGHQPNHLQMLLTPFRLDGLAVGALLAVLWENPRSRDRLTRIALPLGIILTASLLTYFYLAHGLWTGDRFMATIGVTLLAIACGCLVVCAINTTPESMFGRVLNCRPLCFFGMISYGIYVYHNLLAGAFNIAFPTQRLTLYLGHPVLGDLAHVLLSIAGSVLVAAASYFWFEVPVLRLKRHFEFRPLARSHDGA